MSESLRYTKNADKKDKYEKILPQVSYLLVNETDIIANMANICAILKEVFDFFWVGFYIVKGKDFVLGPFQGPLACTRIPYGKGVCGTAWKNRKTIIVEDVNAFEGHIACSSLSQSEIVVPLIIKNEVVAVLDVDSKQLHTFDSIDKEYLEKILVYLHL
jgi:GAF domain-containing protein